MSSFFSRSGLFAFSGYLKAGNNEGIYTNAQMCSKQLKAIYAISIARQNLLKVAMEKMNLSARAYDGF